LEQSPEVGAEFEYEGRYWLYVRSKKRRLGATNHYMDNGVILAPGAYMAKN
jgi:hypothetical protein